MRRNSILSLIYLQIMFENRKIRTRGKLEHLIRAFLGKWEYRKYLYSSFRATFVIIRSLTVGQNFSTILFSTKRVLCIRSAMLTVNDSAILNRISEQDNGICYRLKFSLERCSDAQKGVYEK